jgi:NAD(P)-dependent dehydrogenase (short-subunit alcohol dehydrogenase family)
MTQPSVMITGASTGIGFATAEHLAGKGWHVFAGVRKQADADRLKEALGDAVTPVMCDVTDDAQVKAAGETVRAALGDQTVSGLVNNAGVAVAGPLLHLPIEDMQRQLEINVTGQLRATQAFRAITGCGAGRAGKPGRIVNISSVAGFSAMPLVTPYACSKFAMEAFTQGLRRELLMYGIEVVAINPGPIATPIWDKAEELDPNQYADTDYIGPIEKLMGFMVKRGRRGLPPVKVAEAVYAGLTDAKPRLNTVLTPDRFQTWLLSVLPSRMTDRMIAKQLGLTPEARPW